MPERTACLRCESQNVTPASLASPLAFCLEHSEQRGVRSLGVKATLCQDCGHIEFWVAGSLKHWEHPAHRETGTVQVEDF